LNYNAENGEEEIDSEERMRRNSESVVISKSIKEKDAGRGVEGTG
jgi:hypothetical protein